VAPSDARYLLVAAGLLLALTAAVAAPAGALGPDGGAAYLGAMTPVMMGAPTAVLLVVRRRLRRPGRFLTGAAAAPLRPLRPVLLTGLALAVALVVVPLLAQALAVLAGVREVAPAPELPSLLAVALPAVLAVQLVLSTGEELAWRGEALTVLAPLGFWRANGLVSGVWALWHLPLLTGYALLGVERWVDLLLPTATIVLGGLVLGGARYLSSSVWPAVLGHALMNSVVVLLTANLTAPGEDSAAWLYPVIVCACWAGLVVLVAHVLRRRDEADSGS